MQDIRRLRLMIILLYNQSNLEVDFITVFKVSFSFPFSFSKILANIIF